MLEEYINNNNLIKKLDDSKNNDSDVNHFLNTSGSQPQLEIDYTKLFIFSVGAIAILCVTTLISAKNNETETDEDRNHKLQQEMKSTEVYVC